MVDRNEASADDTAELIRNEKGTAHSVIANVADPESITKMIAVAQERLGAIDGLAYNVGIPGPIGFEETRWTHGMRP